MTGDVTDLAGSGDRFAEASAWFARLRGPDAAALRSEFEVWRSEAENAEAYREMEAIWDASASVSRPAPRRAQRLRPGLIAAGVAAAVTISFLAASVLDRTHSAAIYGSERGAIRTVTLADGSHVTLDTASRISVDLAKDERRVALLAGRARFAVAKDPARPFVVSAGDDAVVARGTLFDVRLRAGGAEVALYEGAVDLERRESRAPPRVLARLRPGQKAVFAANDAPPAIAIARGDDWTDGVLSGQEMRLADVVSEANRYGRIRIVLGDPALGELRISGGFRPADTRSLADAMAAALDLTVTPDPDGNLVLSRKHGGPLSGWDGPHAGEAGSIGCNPLARHCAGRVGAG